jgi:hypothetical protein
MLVHAQARALAWNWPRVPSGWFTRSELDRASLEEFAVGSHAADRRERGIPPRSHHQSVRPTHRSSEFCRRVDRGISFLIVRIHLNDD